MNPCELQATRGVEKRFPQGEGVGVPEKQGSENREQGSEKAWLWQVFIL
jgi:hypothetical protein